MGIMMRYLFKIYDFKIKRYLFKIYDFKIKNEN